MKKWTSTEGTALYGARLEGDAPEWVRPGADFEVNVVLSVPEQAGQTLPVADKMFFVAANGCTITSMNGQPPRRFSDLLPDEFKSFAGDPASDPFAPVEDEIALDANGQFRATLGVRAFTDKSTFAVFRAGNSPTLSRGCRLDIWNSVWAKAQPAIEIR